MSDKRKTGKIAVKRGSDNVFADLGFERPEEELLKAQLVREIRGIIKRRGLTQMNSAELLGLKQPDVSALVSGRVHKFSLERLLRCVRRLDRDVAIVIRPKGSARTTQQHRRPVAAVWTNGAGETPTAPVFIDGKKAATLRGPTLSADLKTMVIDYIERRYGSGVRAAE